MGTVHTILVDSDYVVGYWFKSEWDRRQTPTTLVCKLDGTFIRSAIIIPSSENYNYRERHTQPHVPQPNRRDIESQSSYKPLDRGREFQGVSAGNNCWLEMCGGRSCHSYLGQQHKSGHVPLFIR